MGAFFYHVGGLYAFVALEALYAIAEKLINLFH